jgi:hypothetical protein
MKQPAVIFYVSRLLTRENVLHSDERTVFPNSSNPFMSATADFASECRLNLHQCVSLKLLSRIRQRRKRPTQQNPAQWIYQTRGLYEL